MTGEIVFINEDCPDASGDRVLGSPGDWIEIPRCTRTGEANDASEDYDLTMDFIRQFLASNRMEVEFVWENAMTVRPPEKDWLHPWVI
jgi:hypothetical protein